MIAIPNCYKRKCVHYLGVKNDGECELNERVYCQAFPEKIPDEIAYGNDRHLKTRADQLNEIVFKKKSVSQK